MLVMVNPTTIMVTGRDIAKYVKIWVSIAITSI